jgi:hypothetical protein
MDGWPRLLGLKGSEIACLSQTKRGKELLGPWSRRDLVYSMKKSQLL